MHAVLITAYKDYSSLLRLVRRLDPAFFKAFVHVDKKSAISDAEIDELKALGADVTKEFVVHWGSYTHLQAILHLMAKALDRSRFDYVHIISGQDYPLWNAAEFEKRCDGHIFINYGALNEQPGFVRDRYELGDPFRILLNGPIGSARLHRLLIRNSRLPLRLIRARRRQFGPYASVYKGLVWSSIPGWAAVHMLNDPTAKAFLRAIENTRIPEEIFFQTYFLNSELAPAVVRNDLRYSDWRERKGGKRTRAPAYLDETDVEVVLRSEALFARKVSCQASAKLLDVIDKIRFAS